VTGIVNEGGSMIDRRPNHRSRARSGAAIALVMALALVVAACSGNRSTAKPAGTSPSGTGGTTSSTIIDTSACPAGSDTTGVTGDTITIGTSVAQSGTYAPFSAILDGESAYLDYTNDNGGVTAVDRQPRVRVAQRRRHEEQPGNT
jgi:hypothetical protein